MPEGISNSIIYLAAFFYFCCLTCIIPSVRHFFASTFVMPTPTTGMHFGALDGMRGIAALWVALYHVVTWSGGVGGPFGELFPILKHGNAAVPVFTVLSGFLIYRSFRKVTDMSLLRNYFIRRIVRIYPLYAATIIVLFIYFTPETEMAPFNRLLAELLMLRSFGFETFANPSTWSLYVEFLFYIILPFFISLSGRFITPLSIIFMILFSFASVHGGYEANLWKYFFMGILTSKIIDNVEINNLTAGCLVLLGTTMLYFSAYSDWLLIFFRKLFAGNAFLGGLLKEGYASHLSIVVGLSTMILIVGVLRSKQFGIVLSCSPLKMLGAISYSIFLVHPIFIFASMNVAPNFDRITKIVCPLPMMPLWLIPFVFVPAMITVSASTFIMFERPFLGLKRNASGLTTPQQTQKHRAT